MSKQRARKAIDLELDVRATLARRVKDFRRQQGLTLVGLAGMMGVSLATITNMEAQRGTPSIPMLARLCEVMRLDSVADLILE